MQINDYERNCTCSPATLIVLQAIICREWPDEQMFLSNFLHPTLTLRLLITAVPKPEQNHRPYWNILICGTDRGSERVLARSYNVTYRRRPG